MSGRHDLVDIIRAIAGGAQVPWSDLDTTFDDSTRALLQELQIVARVAQTHGTACPDHANGPAHASSDDQPVPHTWGPLTLLERVGAGAYGEVYRAWDPRLDREVALKLLFTDSLDSSADGTVIEEGRLLARVCHPNVVSVFGADRINGQVGIWTEFIEGQTLAQFVDERGACPPDEACAIAIEVCRGLAAVHQAGLVHGDLNLANVMRQDDGRIVLMDFGASHHRDSAHRQRIAGTPAYMAPEVLAGEPRTVRSDVYSAGVLLFYLLTRTYPVSGATLEDLRRAHRRNTPPVANSRPLPKALQAVVTRALSSSPANRYPAADAMAMAIAGALRAPADGGVRRWRIAVALVLALAAMAALAFTFRSPDAPTAQSRLNFAPRDFVLITRFENRTDDPVFEGAVEYALERELNASNIIGVIPQQRTEDALALMKRPRNTVIDREIGREVALRDGHVKALLTGRVERFGSSYVITAQLVDPANNGVVATIGETADGADAVLRALQRQASRVRVELGERLDQIRGADPNIEQPATTSLQAFQMYNQSYRLGLEGNWEAALDVARRMVQVDPEFAAGWTWLAWAVNNTTRGPSRELRRPEMAEYAARAVQLSERAPQWERHWIQGSYATLTGRAADGIPHYEALLRLRPDYIWAITNLTQAVVRRRRPEDYVRFLELRQWLGKQRPNDPYSLGDAALGAFLQSGPAAAQPFLSRLRILSDSAQPVAAHARFQHDFAAAHIALRSGDLDNALAQVNAIAGRLDNYPAARRVETIVGVVTFYSSLGRNGDARTFVGTLATGPHAEVGRRALAAEAPDPEMRRRLLGPAARPTTYFIHGPDYVHAGLLDEARAYINGNSPNYNPAFAEVAKGQLALLGDDLVSAVTHLERGVELTSIDNHPSYWLGCQSLADALWRSGRGQDAIDRLTECSVNDFRDIAVWGPLLGVRMNLDFHLARLHRLSGNDDKAAQMEAVIRRQLALADADHPLVKQLRRN